MMEWKNIKDIKPVPYRNVNVYTSKNEMYYDCRFVNNGEHGYFVDRDETILNNVTHWMEPLKAPNNTYKKLSDKISRTETSMYPFVNSEYSYNFSASQYLENANNFTFLGIIKNSTDEILIEYLCSEFRKELEKIIKKDD